MPEGAFNEMNKEHGHSEYGNKYLKWCKSVNIKLSPSPARSEEIEKRKKDRFLKVEKRYNEIHNHFREMESRYDPSHKKCKSAQRKFKTAERSYAKAERIFKQEKFTKAVDFLGWDLTLQEVTKFSGVLATISLLLVIFTAIPTVFLLNMNLMDVGIILVPGILVTPLIVYAVCASYPEILAERIKTKSLGRTPEAVNYLVMSMRLSPSLSKAVAFASESTDEPIASGLKKVLWDIYMRKYDTIEESFLAFAFEWGDINEDFKRSLYILRSSTVERSEEGRARILDKAQEIILDGTKRRIESFSSSLHGPTTVLFALGILLPMIIGAMLPLMTLQIPSGTGLRDLSETQTPSSDLGSALTIIILMDVLFPVVAFIYAYHILGKRPGTATPPNVISNIGYRQGRTITSISFLLFLGIGLLGFPILNDSLGTLGSLIGPTPIIIGLGLAIGYYCRSTTKHQKIRRDEIKKMEEEFPDALFKLGSRIAEGEPLETALRKVGDSMKGTKIADLFEKIAYTITVTRSTPHEAIFGKEFGVLNDLPSRTIRASMRTVVESVGKDAQTAGSIIINVSNYLRDMKKIEHDIKTSLSQTVEMMKSTGILFAPLVMGITVSLYVLLSREFASIPGATQVLSNEAFFLVIGVYLVSMVIVITYFSVGIEHGEDRVELRYSLGNAVPIAVFVYVLSLIAGQFMLG